MTFKDRAAQIIELLPTSLALVSLPMGLMRMKASFGDCTRPALWAAHTIRPAQFTDHRKAFSIIYQVLEVDPLRILPESAHLLEIN